MVSFSFTDPILVKSHVFWRAMDNFTGLCISLGMWLHTCAEDWPPEQTEHISVWPLLKRWQPRCPVLTSGAAEHGGPCCSLSHVGSVGFCVCLPTYRGLLWTSASQLGPWGNWIVPLHIKHKMANGIVHLQEWAQHLLRSTGGGKGFEHNWELIHTLNKQPRWS